jgi:hypothetical protein
MDDFNNGLKLNSRQHYHVPDCHDNYTSIEKKPFLTGISLPFIVFNKMLFLLLLYFWRIIKPTLYECL